MGMGWNGPEADTLFSAIYFLALVGIRVRWEFMIVWNTSGYQCPRIRVYESIGNNRNTSMPTRNRP
jgi:hypothetical protein